MLTFCLSQSRLFSSNRARVCAVVKITVRRIDESESVIGLAWRLCCCSTFVRTR